MSGSPAVIIVGAGLMGRWHAHAARKLGARVAAVVDPDPTRAVALAGRHGGCAPFARLEEALGAAPEATIVHVCTPSAAHEALAGAALAAGRHVMVEKPLAPDLATTRRLLEAAAARGRLLCPVHQFVFQRGVLRAHALLPEFGPLRHFDMRVCSAGADGKSDAERDDIALEILPHALALAVRFCPAPITDGAWGLRRMAAGELQGDGAVGGASVTARISMSGRPPVNELRLVGERGAVYADLFHGFSYLETGPASQAGKVARPFALALRHGAAATANLALRALGGEQAYPGLRELVRRFYAAGAGVGKAPILPDETLAVAEVWDRLRAG